MNDSKVEVLTRLLTLAQIIRRRGTPAQASAVLPYEQQLEHDLEQRKAELAELPGLSQKQEEKVAA